MIGGGNSAGDVSGLAQLSSALLARPSSCLTFLPSLPALFLHARPEAVTVNESNFDRAIIIVGGRLSLLLSSAGIHPKSSTECRRKLYEAYMDSD